MKPTTSTRLTTAACVLVLCGISLSANAATLVPVTGITGHDGGNWAPTLGHLSDMVNATDVGWATSDHNPGIDTSADPTDPSQWVNNSGSWQSEWLANSRLDSTTSTNSKIGWVVVDFGAVTVDLHEMFIWSNRYNNPGEDTRDFNLYYSSGVGINTLPGMPNSRTNVGDYDFSIGDWTQIGLTRTLSSPSSPWGPDDTIALGGVSARYIGIEIITAEDAGTRVGLAQIEFTAIPEPTTALLGGLGMLALLRRRR